MMRMAVGMLAALGPLQLIIGDQHGLNTLAHQPIKIAAMEAHWDGSKPGSLVLFAWPDEKTESNLFEIAIPHAGSLILTHSFDGLYPGLKSVAAGRPAAAGAGVLRVPHHGRHRRHHHCGRAHRRCGCGGGSGCSTRAGISGPPPMPGGSASSP